MTAQGAFELVPDVRHAGSVGRNGRSTTLSRLSQALGLFFCSASVGWSYQSNVTTRTFGDWLHQYVAFVLRLNRAIDNVSPFGEVEQYLPPQWNEKVMHEAVRSPLQLEKEAEIFRMRQRVRISALREGHTYPNRCWLFRLSSDDYLARIYLCKKRSSFVTISR